MDDRKLIWLKLLFQDARNKFFADFWRILGGKEEVEAAGPPDEDEFYEACVLDGNKIYEGKSQRTNS